MSLNAMKVLLVSDSEKDATCLREQLESRGCQCWSARSADEVTALVDQHAFDLVLSMSWLRDAMVTKLAGSKHTVFFSYPVRNGCWWLPVLRGGQRCLGDAALRPNELAGVIGQCIRKARHIRAAA